MDTEEKRVIYYCKKCNDVYAGTSGRNHVCPECSLKLMETGWSESDWDLMDPKEHDNLKIDFKTQTESNQGQDKKGNESNGKDVAVNGTRATKSGSFWTRKITNPAVVLLAFGILSIAALAMVYVASVHWLIVPLVAQAIVKSIGPLFLFAIVALLIYELNKTFQSQHDERQENKKREQQQAYLRDPYYSSEYFKQTGYMKEDVLSDSGKFGEYRLANQLEVLKDDGAKFLYNTVIPSYGDFTTEVDLIVVDRSGVYVIENKNYSGWIFGYDDDRMWSEQFYVPSLGRRDKHEFYNPIKQNDSHIRWLMEILPYGTRVFSVVVFGDKADIRGIKNERDDVAVTHTSEAVDEIIAKRKMYGLVYTDEEVEDLYNRIVEVTSDEVTMNDHIRNVKRQKAAHDTCPWCGGKLVEREEAGTVFMGCENYPRCKYTRVV